MLRHNLSVLVKDDEPDGTVALSVYRVDVNALWRENLRRATIQRAYKLAGS